MSACSLVCRDFAEGTLKSKRYIILIFVTILQCMMVQMSFDKTIFYSGGGYNFHEILLGIFSGCEPFFKSGSISFPYGWFALYCCSLLVSFDYMQHDLTHFGIQTLSRIRSRRTWWYAKCIWNISTAIFSYFIIIFTVTVFSMITGISFGLLNDSGLPLTLSSDYFSYQLNEDGIVSAAQYIALLGCPLITIISLSMLQMIFSIIIKPLYSLAMITGLLVLSVAADWDIVFTRTGMTIPNTVFYSDGYDLKYGIIICIIIIILSVFVGGAYFKYYDILPDKEEGK